MTTTQQNVPVLRFKDEQGNDFPDWREKRLGEICSTFKSGNGITMSRIAATGDYPVYGGNGLRGYTDSFTHEGYFMLIGRQGALCGNINRSKGRAYVSEHAIAVQANNDNDTEWLAQKLDFYNLNRFSESSAQPGLSVSRLIRFKLFVPDLTEQQKIATFLSSVDTKIEQLTHKKALWEQYKKGIMQKLFSQEIRFKDEQGNDFPDWEEGRLDLVFSERIEKGHVDQEMLSVTLSNGVVRARDLDRHDNSSADKSKYKKVNVNEIAYNSMRMWQGASGVSKYEGIVSPAYTVLNPKADQYSKFWGFYFKLKSVIQTFQRNSQGLTSDTWNLKFPALSKIKLFSPPNKEEQQKIATFLSAIDQKIELVDTEIKQARAFKKGLLQQMFI